MDDHQLIDLPPLDAVESPEINHPSHPQHTLTLLTDGPPADSDGACRLCGKQLERELYHCSLCDFSLDLDCAVTPPPLAIDRPKAHEHTLALMPTLLRFTCNACGKEGDRSPYLCLQCGFVVHKGCIYLPQIIRITRHPHRLSHTYHVGFSASCGVCHKIIDKRNGAYSCLKCEAYAIHSACATRSDVWDGTELKGIPEEDDEAEHSKLLVEIDGEGMIMHYSHEHGLLLNENHHDGCFADQNQRCQACNLSGNFEPFYRCVDCDFVLHKACADVPRKIELLTHRHPLILHARPASSDGLLYCCKACHQEFNGFRLSCATCDYHLDLRCGTVLGSFYNGIIHESHPHLLDLDLVSIHNSFCQACREEIPYYIHCLRSVGDPDFVLHFKCFTLPKMITHKYDTHPLSLCYGDKDAEDEYVCVICENELDPKSWFYTGNDGGSVFHPDCALGQFRYLRPRTRFTVGDREFEVVPNNRCSRPRCRNCDRRCVDYVVLKCDDNTYLCSFSCLHVYNNKFDDLY